MKIPKEQILEFVAAAGLPAIAEADRELPDIVDTDRDAWLLARFGVDPRVVIGQFNGDGT
jgi:predicted nicotinamide N-methyase